MSTYSAVVFIHVLSGTVLIGSSLFWPLNRAAIRRVESVVALRAWLGFARKFTRPNPIAALVLVASGMYLGAFGWRSSGWFVVAVVLFVVSAVAAGLAQRHATRLAESAAATPDGPLTPDLEDLRSSSRWDAATDLLLANDLAALFLMTNKPGLPGALGVMALALSFPLGMSWARRRAWGTSSGPVPSSHAAP